MRACSPQAGGPVAGGGLWDLLTDLFRPPLKAKLLGGKLGPVRDSAVGEFSLRKPPHYLTVALDLERGRYFMPMKAGMPRPSSPS